MANKIQKEFHTRLWIKKNDYKATASRNHGLNTQSLRTLEHQEVETPPYNT